MKKIILSLIVVCTSTAAIAQDEYKYLTVATTSAERSIELATIQKITFDTAQQLVIVSTSEGKVEFPQTAMQKMFFSTTATAIEAMPAESNSLRISAGTLHAQGKGMLHIYNAAGTLLHMAHIDGKASISTKNLPAGLYIINLGQQTIKFSKQ